MCKHSKMKKLREEISQLRGMVNELEGKVNGHVGHYITPYPLITYTYPSTWWTSGTTYTIGSGNGGSGHEG